MERHPEIVVIKAACSPLGKDALYWLFSRRQLEFHFTEVELSGEGTNNTTARYRGLELPVVRLEHYFGLRGGRSPNFTGNEADNPAEGSGRRYLVLRAPGAENSLLRLVMETLHPLRLHTLKQDFQPQDMPKILEESRNRSKLLGMYRLGTHHLGLFPDISAIAAELSQTEETAELAY